MKTINGIFTANHAEIEKSYDMAESELISAIGRKVNVTKILKGLGASCLIDVHPVNYLKLAEKLKSA